MKKLMILLCCFMSLAACGSCTSKESPPAVVVPIVAPVEVAPMEDIQWVDITNTEPRDLIKQSATEDKIILIFFHHSQCKWCNKMATETFKDQAVVKMVNENFIPIFVEVEEVGALPASFGITAYPAYWFGKAKMGDDGEIDFENSTKTKMTGYFDPEDYVKLLTHTIETL